jgi:hypothetical protein
LARERILEDPSRSTAFRGAARIAASSARSRGFECRDCANSCEIQEIMVDDRVAARWGSKCGKWEDLGRRSPIDAEEREASV